MTDQELAQLSRQLKFMAKNVSNASSGLTVSEIDVPEPQFFDWDAAKHWAEQLAETVKRIRLEHAAKSSADETHDDLGSLASWQSDTAEMPAKPSKPDDLTDFDETLDERKHPAGKPSTTKTTPEN
jgi:hypothetical protein